MLSRKNKKLEEKADSLYQTNLDNALLIDQKNKLIARLNKTMVGIFL